VIGDTVGPAYETSGHVQCREGTLSEAPLIEAELEALRRFDTPTICNALELVVPERRALGFTTQTLICPFPQLPPMIGYARTAMIRSALPPGLSGAEQRQARLEYYRYVASGSGPKIVVIQDVDSRIGFGCFWGEVQTAIHKALGCKGLITDGGVRDLDAVAPEFQVLCGKVTPSHAWVHAIAYGGVVDVFGMVVRSDDLIHADRHGAVVIPRDVAREVARAAELCARREEPILKVARSPDFSLDALERAMAEAAEIH
jgi:regulator of RNase E activity RraA